MAEIEIIYREGYCEFECIRTNIYCMQCHTQAAEDLGCPTFCEDEHEDCGCDFAKFKYILKGMSIKNYELEVVDDPYNQHLNCMMLRTRNKSYQCEKVVLNGEVIYGPDFELLS